MEPRSFDPDLDGFPLGGRLLLRDPDLEDAVLQLRLRPVRDDLLGEGDRPVEGAVRPLAVVVVLLRLLLLAPGLRSQLDAVEPAVHLVEPFERAPEIEGPHRGAVGGPRREVRSLCLANHVVFPPLGWGLYAGAVLYKQFVSRRGGRNLPRGPLAPTDEGLSRVPALPRSHGAVPARCRPRPPVPCAGGLPSSWPPCPSTSPSSGGSKSCFGLST